MVRMGITAKGEDAIETFLNDLEDAPDFKDVSIVNQGFQEEASQGPQVTLYAQRVTCRERGGVGSRSQEPEARVRVRSGSQAAGAKSQKQGQDPGPKPEVRSQKKEQGTSAEESTPNRKPNH